MRLQLLNERLTYGADGVNIAKFTPKVMDKQDKTLYNKIKLRNITYRVYKRLSLNQYWRAGVIFVTGSK